MWDMWRAGGVKTFLNVNIIIPPPSGVTQCYLEMQKWLNGKLYFYIII